MLTWTRKATRQAPGRRRWASQWQDQRAPTQQLQGTGIARGSSKMRESNKHWAPVITNFTMRHAIWRTRDDRSGRAGKTSGPSTLKSYPESKSSRTRTFSRLSPSTSTTRSTSRLAWNWWKKGCSSTKRSNRRRSRSGWKTSRKVLRSSASSLSRGRIRFARQRGRSQSRFKSSSRPRMPGLCTSEKLTLWNARKSSRTIELRRTWDSSLRNASLRNKSKSTRFRRISRIRRSSYWTGVSATTSKDKKWCAAYTSRSSSSRTTTWTCRRRKKSRKPRRKRRRWGNWRLRPELSWRKTFEYETLGLRTPIPISANKFKIDRNCKWTLDFLMTT